MGGGFSQKAQALKGTHSPSGRSERNCTTLLLESRSETKTAGLHENYTGFGIVFLGWVKSGWQTRVIFPER